MKAPAILLAALACTVVIAACQRREPDTPEMAPAPAVAQEGRASGTTNAGNAPPQARPTQADDGQMALAPVDSKALTLLMAVNRHEIAASEQARSKNIEGEARAYADLMHAEHTANQTATNALLGSTPEANDHDVVAQKARGDAKLAAMDSLTGASYAREYIQAMVKGHEDVLKLLDEQLIPMAQAPPVKQHLAATRKHVAMHLEKARSLRASLER